MADVLNKKALVDIIAEETGVTKKAATETIELVFDTISNTLKNGGKVDIPGFGKFEVIIIPCNMSTNSGGKTLKNT